MAYFLPPFRFAEALKAEGIQLPDELANVELLVPVDGIWQLRYTVNLRNEEIEQVGKALAAVGRSGVELNKSRGDQ